MKQKLKILLIKLLIEECIMYYVLCITYYVLCIMYYVLCIIFYLICLLYGYFIVFFVCIDVIC